jgi:hypothetical protein
MSLLMSSSVSDFATDKFDNWVDQLEADPSLALELPAINIWAGYDIQ